LAASDLILSKGLLTQPDARQRLSEQLARIIDSTMALLPVANPVVRTS
jgi:hypothetical protein